MGRRAHHPGTPSSPMETYSREARDVLARDASKSEDSRWAVYKKPLGNTGSHHCHNVDNPRLYRVGSARGSMTFKPGTRVLLSSEGGHPGEIIIGLPPPGRQGATPPIVTRRTSTGGGSCPIAGLDKYYFVATSSGGKFTGHIYLDGTYVSTGDFETAHPGTWGGTVSDPVVTEWQNDGRPSKIAWLVTVSGDDSIGIWDVVNKSASSVSGIPSRSGATSINSLEAVGGKIYWVETAPSKMWLCSADSDGTDRVQYASEGNGDVSSVLHGTPTAFPGAWLWNGSTMVARMPVFSEGAPDWSSGYMVLTQQDRVPERVVAQTAWYHPDGQFAELEFARSFSPTLSIYIQDTSEGGRETIAAIHPNNQMVLGEAYDLDSSHSGVTNMQPNQSRSSMVIVFGDDTLIYLPINGHLDDSDSCTPAFTPIDALPTGGTPFYFFPIA